MRKTQITDQDLLDMGYENTGMSIGNNEVWQDHDYRIIYDPEEQAIVGKYWRERKDCCNHSIKTGSLAVGRREHK